MKRKIHLLPNLLTAFGLVCGLFVIFKMVMLPQVGVELKLLTVGAAILVLAAVADVLDGALARALKAETAFGGLFDSLSDAVTFGVAPPVMILRSLPLEPGSRFAFWFVAGALAYSVCGILRLVRFSVMAQPTYTSDEVETITKKNFVGLPIPAAAAAVTSLNLWLVAEGWELVRPWALLLALPLIGYCMICQWKFPSLKGLQTRVSSFSTAALSVLFGTFIFYGLLYDFPMTFALVAWAYLLGALGLRFWGEQEIS